MQKDYKISFLNIFVKNSKALTTLLLITLAIVVSYSCGSYSTTPPPADKIPPKVKNKQQQILNDIEKIDKMDKKKKEEIAPKKKRQYLKKRLLRGKYAEKQDDVRYSYSLKSLQKEMKITEFELLTIARTLSQESEDKVNIFYFGKHWFMGLESRKIAYQRDKEKKINPVEPLITKGIYGPKTSKNVINIQL